MNDDVADLAACLCHRLESDCLAGGGTRDQSTQAHVSAGIGYGGAQHPGVTHVDEDARASGYSDVGIGVDAKDKCDILPGRRSGHMMSIFHTGVPWGWRR